MKKWLRIALLLFPIHLSAQDTCSCSRNLDLFIEKVTHNYAGFHDKVNTATRTRYDALIDSVRTAAAGTTDKSTCFTLLDTYRAFFWDKHLQLAGSFAHTSGGSAPTPPRTTAWTRATLDQHFSVHREELRTLEGMWSLETYRVGIVYNDSLGAYDAIIVVSQNPNWKEGMVKFTVTEPVDGRCNVRYGRGDMKLIETTGTHAPGHLAMKGIGTWHAVAPPIGAMDPRTFELTYGEEVQWRMLDDTTLYIKLGSCDLKNKAVLDSLVKAHAAELERIPNWIVDFRGNGGGSTDVPLSLLPYLYTKPFKEFGANHWMSPENTALLKAWREKNRDMLDGRSAARIDKWVRYGTKHPNTWSVGHGSTTRFGRGKVMPRRVAILGDAGTASSGESFLELARGMSGKSLIFGENTGGFMDYGDLMNHDLGCDGLVASIPTSRMNRIDHGLSYDRNGIAPDVRIGPEEGDWISFVRQHWAKQR